MAMIDYGALLRVNGVFVNKGRNLFMHMQDDCGFVINTAPYPKKEKHYKKGVDVDGNYFVYAGTKDLLLCFYKTHFYVIQNGIITDDWWGCNDNFEALYIGCTEIKVKSLDNSNRYIAEWENIGVAYEVIFGYGIDPSLWNKQIQNEYDFTKKEIDIINSWFGGN